MVATYNVSYAIRNDPDEFSWTRNAPNRVNKIAQNDIKSYFISKPLKYF
jgi:hypothetical protein